jgi:hypothetical protein
MEELRDESGRVFRLADVAFFATALVAFVLLLLVRLEVAPFFALVGALIVSLVGIGLGLGGINAAYRAGVAALGLMANTLALVLALSIISGIG